MLLATHEPTIESWILNAYESTDSKKQAKRRTISARLGFDPIREPHRLHGKARRGQTPRDAKKVVQELFGKDSSKWLEALQVIPLETLRERGVSSRLVSYLREIEEQLVPKLARG